MSFLAQFDDLISVAHLYGKYESTAKQPVSLA